MQEVSQDAWSPSLHVRAWTCPSCTGLEPKSNNRNLGSGGVGCSWRHQGRHSWQPLSLLWRWDGHRGCPRCGEQPWLPPGQALACLAASPVVPTSSCLGLWLQHSSSNSASMRCYVFSDWSEVTNLSVRFVHTLENRMEEGISSETSGTA